MGFEISMQIVLVFECGFRRIDRVHTAESGEQMNMNKQKKSKEEHVRNMNPLFLLYRGSVFCGMKDRREKNTDGKNQYQENVSINVA